jgi:hypothetical protein
LQGQGGLLGHQPAHRLRLYLLSAALISTVSSLEYVT